MTAQEVGDRGSQKRGRGGSAASSVETRRRLMTAAVTTVVTNGYAAASVRAIAKEADVNSALVFYHFGGVDQLLLAALEEQSRDRLTRHRERVAGARTLQDLVDAAADIYRADLDSGQMAYFSELVAAAVARRDLRAEIVRQSEPWLEFVEETIAGVVGGTPLASLLPPRETAYAALTFYLGINLFSVIDEDRARTDAVFALAARLAPRARLLTVRLPRRSRTARSVDGGD